jgi:hypothetical protein
VKGMEEGFHRKIEKDNTALCLKHYWREETAHKREQHLQQYTG